MYNAAYNFEARFISEMVTSYDESPKCVLYRFVYDPYGLQFYLDRPVNYIYKTFISKYRLSSHSLSIETGRFYNIERNMRTCNDCYDNLIEDEYHFILVCKKYDNIRKAYIKLYYWRRPSSFKLVQLLSAHNVKELNKLGKFLCLAEKIRNNV